MLKKGKEEREIRSFLWDRYVQEVVANNAEPASSPLEPATKKREYRKQDINYWETKTRKSIQRNARKQQRQLYSNRLAEASKMASELYQELPVESRNRSHYQQLTAWAMQFLKEQEQEASAVNTQSPDPRPENITQAKKQSNTNNICYIKCNKGIFYYIPSTSNRSFITRPALLSPPKNLIGISKNIMAALCP